MKVIGRTVEQDVIFQCLESKRPEFLVVFGRRRVGKTYLIKEYFNHRFSFYTTGIADANTSSQLRSFHQSLIEYGDDLKAAPKDWFEAFSRLKNLLSSPNVERDPVSKKRVVFLDELPWMDTARSSFKSALDYFWNTWGSTEEDLLLIVCGSATSWIMNNILFDKGGFYNRVTRRIHLRPFNMKECEELLISNGFRYSRMDIAKCYMIFGGIPYYLNMMDRRMSVDQNVETLMFRENGELRFEFDYLFRTLFQHSEKHKEILTALAEKKGGLMRVELSKVEGIGDGEPLTRALAELEQCGFIRKYRNYTKKKQGYFYQVIDSFTLYNLYFREKKGISSWLEYMKTPSYQAWIGNAFEILCLNHVFAIKSALRVSGVGSTEYSWRSKLSSPGAQIDLLIDREDGIIDICEVKYTGKPFEIKAQYSRQLINKVETFAEEVKPQKALHLILISANGLVRNEYAGNVMQTITLDDLFSEEMI